MHPDSLMIELICSMKLIFDLIIILYAIIYSIPQRISGGILGRKEDEPHNSNIQPEITNEKIEQVVEEIEQEQE